MSENPKDTTKAKNWTKKEKQEFQKEQNAKEQPKAPQQQLTRKGGGGGNERANQMRNKRKEMY